jgi:O-antigen ligase
VLAINGGMIYGHDLLWPTFAPFAEGRQVILYDQRGRGESQAPPGSRAARIEHDALDVRALREALGIPQWDLAAHSWGGGIALLATAPPRRTRIAAAVLAVLCVINLLWLVKGRTGYALVGALALFLLHARAGGVGLALALLAAGALAGAAALGLPVVSARLAGTLGEVRDYLQTGANNATGERLEMWSNALRMIAEAPLLGHGVDAYQGLSAAMYAAKGRVPLEVNHDPHQEFLFVGVEIGLIGLALLAAGLVALWRLAARFDDDWRWITRGAVVIYVSAGLFNGLLNVGWTGYFFGLLLALVAGRRAVVSPGAGGRW